MKKYYKKVTNIDRIYKESLYPTKVDFHHKYYHMTENEFIKKFTEEYGDWRETVLCNSMSIQKRNILKANAEYILNVIDQYDKQVFLQENMRINKRPHSSEKY